MTNSKDIERLINEYISLAREHLVLREDTSTKKLSLLKSWKDRLLEKVEFIESHQIFEDLISGTRELYRDNFFKDSFRGMRGGHLEDMTADWEFLVKTFFYRSGVYIKLSRNELIDIDLVCRQYDEAFTAREVPVRYLAPIELVDFDDVERLDFTSFSIMKFSPQELSAILNNTVNEIFYPDAVWNVDKLSMFWFIEVIIPRVNTNELLQSNDYFAYFGNYRHEPEHLEPIKDVLKILSLFDWNSIAPCGNCKGFHVPFVSQVDEYFLAYPDSFPIGKKLEISNIYENVDYEDTHYYHHKIIDQKPYILFQLEKDNISQFIEFISYVDKFISNILKQWPFFSNALEYLLKAFFPDHFYRPMDQMLWNIVAIEALLGEKGGGITDRLASRLSRILGKSNEERKEIKQKFKKMYELRCNLVHGKSWDENFDREYLFLSRRLAREACMWFFDVLSFIFKSYQFNPEKHFRGNILSLIDTHLIFDKNELQNSLR